MSGSMPLMPGGWPRPGRAWAMLRIHLAFHGAAGRDFGFALVRRTS
jgi:hypothetical protein